MALLVISITNLPPISYFLQEEYHYQNRDGSFKYVEVTGKGLDYEVGKLRFEHFLKENPENPNRTLYRTFTIKPWRFWEWWQITAHWERFSLPYL